MGYPFFVAGRVRSQVDYYVIYLAGYYPDQFTLGHGRFLIVEPAEDTLVGFGVVVLDKRYIPADESVEFSLIKAFIKIAPVVLVDSRNDNFDVSYSGIDQFHNLGTNFRAC